MDEVGKTGRHSCMIPPPHLRSVQRLLPSLRGRRPVSHPGRIEARDLEKPAPGFFTAAAARLGRSLSQVAIIGQGGASDVPGVFAAGLAIGILVRTRN
jgi:hypothetical protein